MSIQVRAPDAYTGDIMSDLNSKRARVVGTSPDDGVTVIEALAPLSEIQRYSTDLRSLTQGRASFHMQFDHYEELPDQIARKVIEAAQKERGEK